MDKLPGVNITVANSSTVDRLHPSFIEHGSYQHLCVLVPVILGVICVLGLASTLTAMGILISNAHRGKLSLINALILNLMFADSLVLAFALPFRAAAFSKPSWTLGWTVCKTCDWFLQSCMAAKSFTVAVMAKACYRYVSNPTKQVSISLRSILLVMWFLWLSACSAPIPTWLFSSLQRETRRLVCVQVVPPEAQDFMSVYVKAYPLGVFCAPLSFALLYFWRVYGQCQRRCSKTQNLRTQIRSRKLTLMLFSLTVAMTTLWLPQWVVWVWERHAAEREAQGPGEGGPFVVFSPPLLLSLSALLLTFFLSLVNPLIVLSLSEEFREGYRGLWRRLTLRKHTLSNPKPGPHAPTAPQSPCPRPETSGQPQGGDGGLGSIPCQGPRVDPQTQMEQGGVGEAEDEAEGESPRDGIVLLDVEQFWHERETGSMTEENDPIPWEHQEGAPAEGRK
ncbi:G-protein coupled receptor 151-like [Salmo salar]|uniref:GPCR-2037 n=1 Tax=Salmo salar TaxID=8030 RepID=A0A1S3SW60_SALSA|nr:G-protein coupled receptor 151-like [Salmo salar]|eukprot:XP_014068577.1 PREDICTED: probable G-protein coupled receptor 151 [Salmo salar]